MREWNLGFLGVGLLLGCEADDPKVLFVDALGYGWRLPTGRALVQPDPEERGPSIEQQIVEDVKPKDVLLLEFMPVIHGETPQRQ